MCNFFSAVIVKDKVLYDINNDSHEELIKKNNLDDTTNKPEFVRVEFTPKDYDIFNVSLSNWELHTDQDFMPKWFRLKDWEVNVRNIFEKEVIPNVYIIDDKSNKKVSNGRWFVKNSRVAACGNSRVVACENASVGARENSSVEAWGNARVEAWENARVEAWGNASVVARENSRVVACENARVEAWGNASVEACGNASVEARENSSVEACGNLRVEAWGNASVEAWGNASVEAWGNASVVARGNSQILIRASKTIKIKGVYDFATVKDLSGNPRIITAQKFKIEIFKE